MSSKSRHERGGRRRGRSLRPEKTPERRTPDPSDETGVEGEISHEWEGGQTTGPRDAAEVGGRSTTSRADLVPSPPSSLSAPLDTACSLSNHPRMTTVVSFPGTATSSANSSRHLLNAGASPADEAHLINSLHSSSDGRMPAPSPAAVPKVASFATRGAWVMRTHIRKADTRDRGVEREQYARRRGEYSRSFGRHCCVASASVNRVSARER
mmetsp:Transcript_7967/g.23612  ORF Transcript_7967/g.23612 Transcript_7967/m.23612 type:complete len:211 (+) Transcript_7967:1567-2199(+)